MAISEVIKAAELIEEAMTAAIDKEHVATWPDLYERLSQEEKNCLFHSMQSNLIPEKRALLQYGALNNRLFFIEKGTVVVATPQEGSKKLKVFAQLGMGDVLVFNGEVGEISRSGCSFAIHCNQKETIRKLLTKSFSLNFICINKGKDVVCSSVGRVVRVSVLLHDDYLIHIGFDTLLSKELDKQLAP
ncbi:MAG: hypothetical protein ACI8PB_004490 [Desulforhopalus sp.]|jgi:hypothetical protein